MIHLDPERVKLMDARARAINFAVELSDLATALRHAALGRATRDDLALIREHVLGGVLLVKADNNWGLMLRSSRSVAGRVTAVDGDPDGVA